MRVTLNTARVSTIPIGYSDPMTSEERQREIREQGSRPAEAQKQQEAQRAREALERAEAERAADQVGSPDRPKPLAEDDPDRPTPRR
jgi:hypothetical protein